MSISVVYEDEHILAVNKPGGLSVHKTHPKDPNTTLADILAAERPSLRDVGENPLRPGIVHRLDKDTSGVMLIAKDQAAFEHLKSLFARRLVKKYYLALVVGHMAAPRGTIDLPLGKVGTRQTTRMKGRRKLTERDAVTDYEVLRVFRDHSLLRVMPRTGRTHQIRVHLKAVGHPVAGDDLYGPKGVRKPSGLDRMFLHAQRLEFTAPDGKALALETDLPQSLQKVLDTLESSDT